MVIWEVLDWTGGKEGVMVSMQNSKFSIWKIYEFRNLYLGSISLSTLHLSACLPFFS